MRYSALFFACLLAPGAGVSAETVYKSVDAQGRVTYSAEPPAGATETERIVLQPGPSDADRQQALQRERQLQDTAKRSSQQLEQARKTRKESVGGAEAELEKAKLDLARARIMRDEDWQGKAGGGRRLRPEYFERVKNAEAAFKAAEDALAKARRDAR